MILKIRKLFIPVISAVLILSIAAGCSFAGAKKEPIVYERFGLTLEIPKEYEGVVDFAPTDELDDNTYITAYHIPSRDAGCGGWLFSIVRHTHEEFLNYYEFMEGSGGARHFATDNKYVYSLQFPTDVQIAPEYWQKNDEVNTEASISYLTNQDEIIANFIARNVLTPYSPEFFENLSSEITEKTYRLVAFPVECESESEAVTIYLTSITLRKDSALCSFIRDSNDAPLPVGFPDIIAIAEDGAEYTLTDVLSITGGIVYGCTNLPVTEVVSLKINGVAAEIKPPYSKKLNTEVYLKRLKELPKMGYSELFAYCAGSDGAYAEGVYFEMAKRLINNPEEFAVHFMMPAYPFEDDYKKSLETIDLKYSSTLGFDRPTNYEICSNILYECRPDERDAVIEVMRSSKYEIVKQAAELFLESDNINEASGSAN